ncbi:PF11140 domain protein [Bacteriovorax sp. DB6_IX]|uniref:PF11140 domain protein n=1 Tax=Bacteriovorax sp. DB6_IX TaxID=1353530 RepID=UPI00038A35B7|nr:PF11140 domain protein [Bacteriovorax sp. DB6_IX]EQC51742.1 PF11140 domain protein [Bacteriovorax sp. DB6_IX]
MRLLVFAHRGEAQTFLKELSLKSHPKMNDLYISEEIAILLCSEGLLSSVSKLSFALGKLENCHDVINFGICGALESSIELGSIHRARTIYAENEFKSYSQNEHDSIDLITAKSRALTSAQAEKLNVVAQLVDREAWGLAHVCKEYGVDFQAIKLVSDHITDAEICQLIKDQAEVYSDKLYDYYQRELNQNKEAQSEVAAKIFSHPEFYFTVSQKRQFNNLLSALSQKEGLNEEDLELDQFIQLDLLPKQRAKLLCDWMTKRLYPFKSMVQEKLEELTSEMKTYGAEFKFDKNLEKSSYQFQVLIESEQAQNHMGDLLKKFPWDKFEKIMKGDFNV